MTKTAVRTKTRTTAVRMTIVVRTESKTAHTVANDIEDIRGAEGEGAVEGEMDEADGSLKARLTRAIGATPSTCLSPWCGFCVERRCVSSFGQVHASTLLASAGTV